MTREEWAKVDGDEAAAIGRAIYREKIRPLVHPQHKGKLVVIDLETGDYEMDYDSVTASERLEERRPECYTFTVRVGYRAAFHIGGSWTPDDEC